MKQLLILFLFCGLSYAGQISSKDGRIAALYHMNTGVTAIDEKGENTTDGSGGTVAQITAGKVYGAKYFSGYLYKTLCSSAIGTLTDFTITAWARYEGSNTDHSYDDAVCSQYYDASTNTRDKFVFMKTWTTKGPYSSTCYNGASESVTLLPDFTRSCVGQWVFCVTTYDSTNNLMTATVYFGTETYRSSTAIGFTVAKAFNVFSIGRRYSLAATYFLGYIDELAIWNRVLSTWEQTAIRDMTYKGIK